MMSRPVICIGHSHIGAVSKGAALSNRKIIEFRLREIGKADKASKKDGLGDQVRDKLAAAVREHRAKSVICFCGGGTPAVMGLVQHPLHFDFVLPEQSDLPFDSGAVPIPFSAIRATMALRLRKHRRVLAQLAKISPAKLIQVESPPPAADEAFVTKAAAKYDPDVRTLGISSAHLRYKFWKLHSSLFEELCAKFDIGYVKNPPEVFDAAGYLAKPYWGDYVHANAEYGALILRHLEGLDL
jgi:hypothetical protein